MGVPSKKILTERTATNTGENIQFSYTKLCEKGISVQSVILVQMPMMERRTYATFMKQWEGATSLCHVRVTSPPMTLEDFPNDDVGDMRHTLVVLLGCMDRLLSYPRRGFQIVQSIPTHVSAAHKCLCNWRTED